MVSDSCLKVTEEITIQENELDFVYTRASGPGGQNVNKLDTAVQLRFDINRSQALSDEVKDRLRLLARNRVSSDGILMIDARRFRTQEQNRQDALRRLIDLIGRAAQKPKIREKTRPSEASKQRRLEGKRRRSALKRLRAWRPEQGE